VPTKPTYTPSKKPSKWGTPPAKKSPAGSTALKSGSTTASIAKQFNKPNVITTTGPPKRKVSNLANKFEAPAAGTKPPVKQATPNTPVKQATPNAPVKKVSDVAKMFQTPQETKPKNDVATPIGKNNIADLTKKFAAPPPEPLTQREPIKIRAEASQPHEQEENHSHEHENNQASSYEAEDKGESYGEVENSNYSYEQEQQQEEANTETNDEPYEEEPRDENEGNYDDQAEDEGVIAAEQDANVGLFTPERIFVGGVADVTEEELQQIELYLSSLNQNASLNELRGVENVIDNTSYSQVLVTATKEEIEEQISEYTESCKVIIYGLNVTVYIGIAWQNNDNAE